MLKILAFLVIFIQNFLNSRLFVSKSEFPKLFFKSLLLESLKRQLPPKTFLFFFSLYLQLQKIKYKFIAKSFKFAPSLFAPLLFFANQVTKIALFRKPWYRQIYSLNFLDFQNFKIPQVVETSDLQFLF